MLNSVEEARIILHLQDVASDGLTMQYLCAMVVHKNYHTVTAAKHVFATGIC